MNQFLSELFRNQDYDKNNFFLIAGPCVVESEELVTEVADKVFTICKKLGIPYIFKASYKKANRTSANSFTSVVEETGVHLINRTAQTLNRPSTTEIPSEEEAKLAAN